MQIDVEALQHQVQEKRAQQESEAKALKEYGEFNTYCELELKENFTLKHIQYDYTELFLVCLVILVLI